MFLENNSLNIYQKFQVSKYNIFELQKTNIERFMKNH